MSWMCDGDSTASIYRQGINCDQTQLSGSGHDIYVLTTKDFTDDFRDSDLSTAIASGGATLRICSNSNGTGRLAVYIAACVPNTTGSNADIRIYVQGAGFNSSTSGQKVYAFWGGSGNTQPAASATYGQYAVFASECKAAYTFAEDPSTTAPQLTSKTSQGHHGTSQGTMTSGDLIDGQAETAHAWDFDGTNDFVGVSNHADFQFSTSMTLCCWVKFHTGSSGQQSMITKWGSGTSSQSYALTRSSTKKWELYLRDGGTLRSIIPSSPTASDDQWYFVCASVASGSVLLYVDGAQIGSTSLAQFINNSLTSFRLGSYLSTSFLDGSLSDTIVFSDGKSADWITSYYNNTKSGSSTFSAESFTDGSSTGSSIGSLLAFRRNCSLSGNLQTQGMS